MLTKKEFAALQGILVKEINENKTRLEYADMVDAILEKISTIFCI